MPRIKSLISDPLILISKLPAHFKQKIVNLIAKFFEKKLLNTPRKRLFLPG